MLLNVASSFARNVIFRILQCITAALQAEMRLMKVPVKLQRYIVDPNIN